MALFRRNRTESQPEEPDTALPVMTTTQADTLRQMVHDAFAERGVETTVFGDHLQSGTNKYGLHNIAEQCRRAGDKPARWRRIIDAHAEAIVAGERNDPFAALQPDEIAARTYLALYAAQGLPDGFPAVEFAPGIVQLLTLDLPDSVVTYDADHIERFGGWSTLHGYALANLRRETDNNVEVVNAPGGGTFRALVTDSVYTASRAVLMPQVAHDVAGDEPGEFGWLLALPNRHQLCWHMVRDASVVPTIETMARIAASGGVGGVRPISPNVYWWNGRSYQRITSVEPPGRIAVNVEGEFQDVLSRLMGAG